MNKLSSIQIQVGQPVPFDCYDGQGNLLLKKGLIVDTQKKVDFLLERGLFTKSGLVSSAPVDDVVHEPRPPTPFELLDGCYNRLKQLLSLLLVAPDAGVDPAKLGFPERTLALAEDIQKLCELDADAMLGAIHLQHQGRYSVQHPLYRAVVCELLAIRKDMEPAERRNVLAAALTCDVSTLKLQDELFRQKDPLLPQQQQAVASHPVDSARMLRVYGVANEDWLTSVLQHHELPNGTGYPYHLSNDDVSVGARILRLADTYTAMITPRTYRKPLLSKAAMRGILLTRGKEVDEELAISVIKELGVYPPGAFVKLLSGELAIVTRRAANPKAPAVKAVVGPRGAPYDKALVRKTDTREYEILDVVDRDIIVKIDLDSLWGYET